MKPQDRIARHFARRGYYTYTEVILGLESDHPNRPRADVYAIREYLPLEIHIVEWKESRADFLAEIKSEKWIKYLDHCRHFSFATPCGLISMSEIPEGVGWLEEWENGKGFNPVLESYDYEFTMSTDQMLTLFAKSKVGY